VLSDAQILASIERAFAGCARPDHFTNYTHCDECAEHDEILRSRDVVTLCLEDVGNPGWDPICFISPQGFVYYLPALARLALAEPTQPRGWYGPQLVFHLCSDGRRSERVLACTPEQRRPVVALLQHILETRVDLVDAWLCGDDLLRAIKYWADDLCSAIPG
jgi:hypothetical protein